MKILRRQPGSMGGRNPNFISGTIHLLIAALLLAGCVPPNSITIPVEAVSTPTRTAIRQATQTETPARTPTSHPTLEEPPPQPAIITLTFNPDADAYVKRSAPHANFGDEVTLDVDGGSDPDESFLRFTVKGISGTVQSAILQLYAKTNGSNNGPAIYAAGASWSEKEITWNNRPTPDGEALDNQDQIGPETWVKYDVSPAVQADGTYDFVIAADSKDAVGFSSRESNRSPELVIRFITEQQPAPTPTLSIEDVVLVGAGDIATCSNDNDELTARLLDGIPGTVFTTGDNAYENGIQKEYMDCYDPAWGRHKERTHPTPGNRDYHTPDASGYFEYFDSIPSYYAYDLGSWRIYALNSEAHVDDDSKQARWLRLDLATHPSQCVLAYWHRPRWSSGSTHGSRPEMQVLWEILYESGAELVINGLEHNYERFTPMNAEGQADPLGMREIVTGTGGAGHNPFGDPLPASEVRNNSTYGVLKLTLRSNSYDWEFIPVAGSTFTDSGSTECH